MNNDERLLHDVEQALKWEPLLANAEVGAIVQDGIVTLTGSVDTYAKKRIAEHATKSVKGVRAVIEKIEVNFSSIGNLTDTEIAKDVLRALKSCRDVPENQIQVQVEHGWVTLEGTVKLNVHKQAAQLCLEHIMGVRAVDNKIIIRSGAEDEIEKLGIQNAMIRNWTIDENQVKVDVFKNTVTLTGMVNSLFQKDEAERMAWKAPGVWNVHNELLVSYISGV